MLRNQVRTQVRFPGELMARLRVRAETDHRSANATMIVLLEQALDATDSISGCSQCGASPVYIGTMCRACHQAAQGKS